MSHPKFLALAAIVSAMACQSNVVRSDGLQAPPRVCEIRQAAWCIYRSDVTIQHEPIFNTNLSAWTIWGSYWREHPAVILEPRGCRTGTSDVVQLMKTEDAYQWKDRIWNSVIVRLHSDGTCDLNLLSPTVREDARKSAFSAKLTLIRACQTTSCDGPTIGESLWPALQRQK